MSNNESNTRRLSRREWLRIVGASGLTAVAGAVGSLPGTVLAAPSAQDETPEAFLAQAYAQRAQAMTAKSPSLLESLYDTSNPKLLSFEKDRSAFMSDLGSRWNGTVLSYNSTVSLLDMGLTKSTATVRLKETTQVKWIPQPVQLPPEAVKLRQQFPEKFASSIPRGSQGEITSAFGVRHELALERGAGGWRIVQDGYEEPDLFGVSPDLVPGSWAAERLGKPSNGTLKTSSTPTASDGAAELKPMATTATNTYYWATARDYAFSHWSSYNGNYCNFNGNCGGDCANFVSQCLLVITSAMLTGRPTVVSAGPVTVQHTVRQMQALITGPIISCCEIGLSTQAGVLLARVFGIWAWVML